jgi:peroxiredoxin/predicted 2-oxoglutarate/Fe(II)-dependent dioxygenase YbiX
MVFPIRITTQTMLTAGDSAPHFRQRTANNPQYAFDSAAGRYLVLCFYGSAAHPYAKAALKAAYNRPDLFNDSFACFFGVSNDPDDENFARVTSRLPGYRHFWDFDFLIAKLYGVVGRDFDSTNSNASISGQWVIVDPTMRVLASVAFRKDQSDFGEVMKILENQPPPERFVGFEIMAPVLVLPRVFEPIFCEKLIGLYESNGGYESGFMRQIDGKTVAVNDTNFKQRKDYTINDNDLILEIQTKILRRVVPQIEKIHKFTATRMERYIVACYAADDGGHFSAHRDDTTKGTAHRRFAVSINLNSDFEGGEVSFPEYGPRSFKAPIGGAVVFSCSLLHKVSKVTKGRRYAFLPFLYDDAAAKIREANLKYLEAK